MTTRRAQAIATRRDAIRARIAAKVGAKRRPQPRQDRRRWLLLLLLLLLLLIRPCDEDLPVAAPIPAPEAPAPAPSPPPEPPIARVAKRPRPPFQAPAPEPLPWLAAFRLQVASRSPRLAECFVGVARPGALKWTVAVDPRTGRVADPTLEPTLSGDGLTPEQRTCALGVLSEPTYTLEAGAARSTPSRVGMVIEF